MSQQSPRILFLGSMYAGHSTRFLNLKAHSRDDVRIRPTYRTVTGWRKRGTIEALPMLPDGAKGRLRAAVEAAPFASMPRPDVIWSSVREMLTPFLWAQWGPLRRPLVMDLDWTLEQQEAMAVSYYGRAPKSGVRMRAARMLERLVWRTVSVFSAWSRWAANSLRDCGIDEGRIRVIPPGVDLDDWRPRPERDKGTDERLRLLFVGGDFVRKGGQTLLDVFRARFSDRCDLDIVTQDDVEISPGVRVHKAQANSQRLRDLYAQADAFVMPSYAECFGIATVEAMATGLPTIVSDVGGSADIVSPGETGWLIKPDAGELARVLEVVIDQRDRLPQMGRMARARAEVRFDGRVNDRAVLDLLLAVESDFRGKEIRVLNGRADRNE